ncbi:hypothetical protein Q787_09680 [Ornithobacterium rhinotracheale H06-030791]|nr:hypothetical protein Q785_09860 [Ornithobacterium rhinotracheale ORT-UMN 88]KGB66333.1 hypothetical protein Q787_09680 [Ornithobacterium rhinotracheale H06-030791]
MIDSLKVQKKFKLKNRNCLKYALSVIKRNRAAGIRKNLGEINHFLWICLVIFKYN